MFRRIKVEEELRIAERKGMLNIQPLVVRSSPHSSSFLECVKRRAYNEKIQFVQTIIQDIDTTRKYVVEFLCKSRQCWCSRE